MSRDALVVGISHYQFLPGLNAPAQDAEAIAQALQHHGDFRVTRMPEIVQEGRPKVGFKSQVTVAELETALVRLFKPKGNNIPHTALFYFSGHGLQKDAGIQEGYLATSDVNPPSNFYGLSLFWLRRLLQESPVRQRIILLDCCNSGELLNFLEADPGAKSGTDRLFMAAAREYEAAYESITGNYSVFTQALLDGLDPTRVGNGTVTNYALTDWVSNALKSEMQQPLFENSGSEIVLTRCQQASTIIKTELAQEICPYRGLEFFDEAHAEYFFGREELTDQLIEKLRTRNFVAVVGASGSGKSSLIRAGLIHKLRQGQKFSGSDRWRIQLITPTDQPLKSLATAFVNPKDSAIDRAEQLRRAEVLLRDGGSGLYHLVRASLLTAKQGRNSRLLLIIDQFEEVFTLCHGAQAERDRHSFFNCLITALRESSDCLSVVIVLRADFFGKYSLYQGLAEQIEQNLVTVTPLTYDQIKASVVKPAQKTGLVCEPNLVYNILLDVVGAPGELPLLQYTLLELWERRQPGLDSGADRLTLDAYTELGGVRGTLQKRANEIFYSLTQEEQRVAKRIFIALTQLGEGTEDTRRRILKSELISPKFPAELVDRVVEKLVAAKLIVTNRVTSTSQFQEKIDQRFANVSTALRLAQIRRGKTFEQRQIGSTSSTAQSPLPEAHGLKISGITQLSTGDLLDLSSSQLPDVQHQETIDVAHEALIRNWSMLRVWLDENRELVRRQRRIEHAAREWYSADQPRSAEYLMHGDRLVDAEDYLVRYSDELSALAQRYVVVSREESRRAHKELRLLQVVVPCTLLVALIVTFNQYWAAMKNQDEKDYQLQIATSRQQAAIAQSILQDPDGDPTAALLISRLAAQGGYTYEAEASLRVALQKLRLQGNLGGGVRQVTFSPDQRRVATAREDGTIQIRSLETQSVEQVLNWNQQQNNGGDDAGKPHPAPSSTAIAAIAFSPNSKQLAAIAQTSGTVKVWSVESGALEFKLDGFKQAATKLAFSPNGVWIAAASADNTVRIWRADSGILHRTLSFKAAIHSLEFSPDSHWLLTASGSTAQLWQASSGRLGRVLRHTRGVTSATFSSDRQWVATACEDGIVRLWQAATGRLHRNLGDSVGKANRTRQTPTQVPNQVMFSPNGQFLAMIAGQQVLLWNVHSGQLQSRLYTHGLKGKDNTGQTVAIAFSPDSQRLVTADRPAGDNRSTAGASLWHVQTGHLLGKLPGESGVVELVQFSRDGSLVATASTTGKAHLWAAETGGEFLPLKLAGQQQYWARFHTTIPSLALNSSRTTAAISSNPSIGSMPTVGLSEVVAVAIDGSVHRWHLMRQPSAQTGSDNPGSLSAMGQAQASDQSFPTKVLNVLKFVGQSVWSLGYPSERRLDRSLFPSLEMEQRSSQATSVASLLVNNSAELQARSTDQPVSTAAKLGQVTSSIAKISSDATLTGAAFGTANQVIATVNTKEQIEIWQVQPGGMINRLRQLESPPAFNQPLTVGTGIGSDVIRIRHLAFSFDDHKLLGIGDNHILYIWDVASGKLLKSLQGHTATVEQAQFSPDGELIVSASYDQTARIWRVSSGQLLKVLQHQDIVASARFSPDSQLIVTASWDGTARVLDRVTGAWRVVLAGHRGAVLDAEFSPDGRQLVTASADGTARLWDAQTGTERVILRSERMRDESEPIQKAFFSQDGRYVATVAQDGQLNVWSATWDELLGLARDRSLRQLKPEECLRYLRLPPNACPTLEMKE